MSLLTYRWLERQPYEPTWKTLSAHADAVGKAAADEVVFSCEHEPVYTTGRRGVDNRLTDSLPAPVFHSDRGGEMTFHGPGQVMLYPVIHLRRREIGIRDYVWLLEESCIQVLSNFGIEAGRNCGFPGVWVGGCKIAALGVRVTRGVAFHGMALNIDTDPVWFAPIRPCGLEAGVMRMSDLIQPPAPPVVAEQWQACFQLLLGEG